MQQFIVRWRRPRRALSQPEHNQYTPTIFPGVFPTWWSVPTHYINFEIKLQTVPELNTYTPTIFDAVYPSWLTKPTTRGKTWFSLQLLPESNEYPVPNLYPAWAIKPTKSRKTKFNLQSQPELNRYITSLSDADYPTWLAKETFRTKFIRHHLKIQELNNYPVIVLSVAPYPSWLTRPVEKVKARFNLQSTPELNTYTPIISDADYPTWLAKETFRTKFIRHHLKIQELNTYTTSLSIFAPIPAWALHFEKTKDLTKRRLRSQPELNKYTPATFVVDYPTWLAKETFRTKFIRHHLKIQELNNYPVIVLSVAPLPSTILERSIRVDSDNATRRKSTSAMMLRMELGTPTFEAAIGVGFSTLMTNDGIGKVGLITKDGIGETGEI